MKALNKILEVTLGFGYRFSEEKSICMGMYIAEETKQELEKLNNV